MEAPPASDSCGGVAETLGFSVDDPMVEVTPAAAASRVEIDTSAPFESVKEAVDRFGGSAAWNTQLKQLFLPEVKHCFDEADVSKLEELAAQLRRDLIVKERETLGVLKELEMTKKIADGLKLRLKEGTSKVIQMPRKTLDKIKVYPLSEANEHNCLNSEKLVCKEAQNGGSSQSERLILVELKQTTVNLNEATNNLADIKASIELLHSELMEERLLLEKTREKLILNSATVTALEKEVNQATEKLQGLRHLESKMLEDPSILLQEINQTKLELEQSRKMTESAKIEVTRLTSEIEQTKTSIKTAEIRWLAAKKMKAAARTAEVVALAEIKGIQSSNNLVMKIQNNSVVTLSLEDYNELLQKAQKSDETSRRRIEMAMQKVDEANRSKAGAMMKMEEATAAMKACKEALEQALTRAETANRGKLAVEEALRSWRFEHGHKRRNAHSSTRFKNSAAHRRRNSRMLDLNGSSLISNESTIDLSPPMSIGQILSMKRMVLEEYEDIVVTVKENVTPKVSLGEMLGKDFISSTQLTKDDGSTKKHQSSADKRKKIGFVGFSRLLTKQSKRKKKRRQSFS